MEARRRTNQLLYRADLLLGQPAVGDVEQQLVDARRAALEEGALALIDLALDALVAELLRLPTWPQGGWRSGLIQGADDNAELSRLSAALLSPEGELRALGESLEALRGFEVKAPVRPGMIAVGNAQRPSVEMSLVRLKALTNELRESALEW
ncbi:DUF6586 family protein [Halotalea alkalilenta]|uniref:Uncharacterized protein n=1 Tax=Halotalea alkalilenta TaxID=376489 RepID=A0A172YF47_9GAMM|nr:DUF6586 family protein [Halotalea alkalilenta]ANF57888.1 hypothetical protein A5892_10800 [Halotalea alkalilenta]